MPIYTRTGDRGRTSLFNGKKISKDSARIEAIGSIDELNAVLGTVIAKIKNSKFKIQNDNAKLKNELERIQTDLFEIGTILANPKSDRNPKLEKRAREFEKLIDGMTKAMPRLMNFILPGGGEAGANLHLARTICRRAERSIVRLSKKNPSASSGQEEVPSASSGQEEVPSASSGQEEVPSTGLRLRGRSDSRSLGQDNVLVYINRLSDLLFTMARYVNFKEGKKETIWKNKNPKALDY